MTNYAEVKKLLNDVPVDEAGRIKEEFFGWPPKTEKKFIEAWFNKKMNSKKEKK